MSLMEFCGVREGVLVQTYEKLLVQDRCAWCEESEKSLQPFGAMSVCPECFGKAERKWNERKG